MQRWRVGDVSITSVVELESPFPGPMLLHDAEPDAVRRHGWLRPHFADDAGNLLGRIQMLVVESAGLRIVVDTCVGNDKDRTNLLFNHMQLPFLQSFADAGYDPQEIDVVVCTHLHVDHVGWNTMLVGDTWQPTFPNARYLFGRVEWEHWDAYGVHEDGAIHDDSVRPVIDAGLADLVEFGHDITAEVSLQPTTGHTPGHQSVYIRSGGREAVITGDLMHHPVQCSEPHWPSNFDSDPAATEATRRAFLDRHADTDTLIIGTHFATPTSGYIKRDGDVWRFEGTAG